MGNSVSEEANHSSQQAQPVARSDSANCHPQHVQPVARSDSSSYNPRSAQPEQPVARSDSANYHPQHALPVARSDSSNFNPRSAQPVARSDSANYSPQQVQPVARTESDSALSRNSAKIVLPPTTNNRSVQNNKTKDNQLQKVAKLPHNCETILKDADSTIDRSSTEKLYQQLHAGVFLNGKKKKYWVDKRTNINCFMIFANGLTITWGDNPRYWYLHNVESSDHGKISVAQLREVCWLEVHGRLDTANLTPGVTYQIAYVIMLELSSFGWEVPVNFRLTLPNGSRQEHQEKLNEKPKGDWIRIPVGEFKASPEYLGEIEFSLYEIEGGNWKKGLVIKYVSVEPKF